MIFDKLICTDQNIIAKLKRLHIFIYYLHEFNKLVIASAHDLCKGYKLRFKWLDLESRAIQNIDFLNYPSQFIWLVGVLMRLIDGEDMDEAIKQKH